jgi:hypothetical protein
LLNKQQGFIHPIEDLGVATFPNIPGDGSCHRGLGGGAETRVQQVVNTLSTIQEGEGVPDLPSFAATNKEMVNILHPRAEGARGRGSEQVSVSSIIRG